VSFARRNVRPKLPGLVKPAAEATSFKVTLPDPPGSSIPERACFVKSVLLSFFVYVLR
jgi:hypothetical protein